MWFKGFGAALPYPLGLNCLTTFDSFETISTSLLSSAGFFTIVEKLYKERLVKTPVNRSKSLFGNIKNTQQVRKGILSVFLSPYIELWEARWPHG